MDAKTFMKRRASDALDISIVAALYFGTQPDAPKWGQNLAIMSIPAHAVLVLLLFFVTIALFSKRCAKAMMNNEGLKGYRRKPRWISLCDDYARAVVFGLAGWWWCFSFALFLALASSLFSMIARSKVTEIIKQQEANNDRAN